MVQTRNTQQRKLIMSLMDNNRSHPTADEIYELARERDPHISRGTVYRNLNFLAGEGDIRRLAMPSGPDHFDCNTKNHYHFLCRRCNRVVDINLRYNEAFNLTPPEMDGFKTEWHRLLMVGLCPDCLDKEEKA